MALQNYKSTIEFSNVDFNSDKPKQCEAVRRTLALLYEADPYQFGPVEVAPMTLDDADEDEKSKIVAQQKLDKELIKRGYNRVQEKKKRFVKTFLMLSQLALEVEAGN